jgi:hypothetical protein
MALLALTAATAYIADSTLAAGLVLPATETSLASNTGLTFPNLPSGLVLLRVVVGSGGAGNLTFVAPGNSAANIVTAVANSTSYLFGPFSQATFGTSAGLIQVNFSVVTGNSAGVYLIDAAAPLAAYRTLHNPFEKVAGTPDW